MDRPVSFLQTDSRWASVSYSAAGEHTTIGASGCGPTAMAMVLATWCDEDVTPRTECAWARAHGFKAPHQGTYYGYFEAAGRRYGLTVSRLNYTTIYGDNKSSCHAKAKAALDAGNLVIACMGPGNWTSSGHYVVCYRIQGDTIYINDPASTKVSRTQGSYGLFKRQVKFYWVINCPERLKKQEEPIDMTKAEVVSIVNDAFRNRETARYDTLDQVPSWAKGTVQKLTERGALQGDGASLGLDYATLRVLVVHDRLGLYD